jgi:D-inositol-3-phosphate glycosyltransferase
VYVREVAQALGRQGLAIDIITSVPAQRRPAVIALSERVRVLALPKEPGGAPGGLKLPHYDVVHSHYWQSAAPARALVDLSGARHVHTFHTFGRVKNRVPLRVTCPSPPGGSRSSRTSSPMPTRWWSRRRPRRLSCWSTPAAPRTGSTRSLPASTRACSGRGAAGRFAPGSASAIDSSSFTSGASNRSRASSSRCRLCRPSLRLARDCALLVAGGLSGPRGRAAMDALEREASKLPPHIELRLVGRWPHRRLPELFGAADASVVCSHSESFCLAALEAQACGVPVIGTAVGGLPSLIADGHNGFLADRRPDAFAERLGEVLACRRRRRAMGAAAVEVARRYSWAATASAIRAVYDV